MPRHLVTFRDNHMSQENWATICVGFKDSPTWQTKVGSSCWPKTNNSVVNEETFVT